MNEGRKGIEFEAVLVAVLVALFAFVVVFSVVKGARDGGTSHLACIDACRAAGVQWIGDDGQGGCACVRLVFVDAGGRAVTTWLEMLLEPVEGEARELACVVCGGRGNRSPEGETNGYAMLAFPVMVLRGTRPPVAGVHEGCLMLLAEEKHRAGVTVRAAADAAQRDLFA